MKGDGEIIEEIVSRDRHREINRVSGFSSTKQDSPHGKLLKCGHNSSVDDVVGP